MAISVIISNFNGAKYLPRLIETLKGQQGVTFEIIVVDRNSTDGSPNILALHPDVKVIQEPPESGLVAGYAAGVLHARHDKFFFCNEDMWFPPDCLHLLESLFLQDPALGAAMPYQVRYDGSDIVNTGIWFRETRWYRGSPNPFREWIHPVLTQPARVSCVNAGACMLSRPAYNSIGGWDTSFYLDHEDTDLAVRLWQKGFFCRVQPASLVFHAVGASNAKLLIGTSGTVGVRRYVANLSNMLTVGLKYFSAMHLAIPFVIWIDFLLRDVLRGRLRRAWWDILAAILTLKRLPSILRFRREWRQMNNRARGQDFFRASEFHIDALPREIHEPSENLIKRAKEVYWKTGQ
jgi:GT2 family glycosyltransferase